MQRVLGAMVVAVALPSAASGSGSACWARAEIASEVAAGYSPWRGGVRLRVQDAEVARWGVCFSVKVEVTATAEITRTRTAVAMHFYDARGRHLRTSTVRVNPGTAGVLVAIKPGPAGAVYVSAELEGTGLRTRRLRLTRK